MKLNPIVKKYKKDLRLELVYPCSFKGCKIKTDDMFCANHWKKVEEKLGQKHASTFIGELFNKQREEV